MTVHMHALRLSFKFTGFEVRGLDEMRAQQQEWRARAPSMRQHAANKRNGWRFIEKKKNYRSSHVQPAIHHGAIAFARLHFTLYTIARNNINSPSVCTDFRGTPETSTIQRPQAISMNILPTDSGQLRDIVHQNQGICRWGAGDATRVESRCQQHSKVSARFDHD
jgi:hypothetical protein